jgi:hypothetical protein
VIQQEGIRRQDKNISGFYREKSVSQLPVSIVEDRMIGTLAGRLALPKGEGESEGEFRQKSDPADSNSSPQSSPFRQGRGG